MPVSSLVEGIRGWPGGGTAPAQEQEAGGGRAGEEDPSQEVGESEEEKGDPGAEAGGEGQVEEAAQQSPHPEHRSWVGIELGEGWGGCSTYPGLEGGSDGKSQGRGDIMEVCRLETTGTALALGVVYFRPNIEKESLSNETSEEQIIEEGG